MKAINVAVILVALVTTACSAGSVSLSALPSSPPAATASPVTVATPSATPLATPSPLPEGTYQTAPIPTATLKATAEAAGFTWDAASWTATTTVYAIRLANGQLNWFCSADGATPDLCSSGTYTVTDDHTVAYTDAQNPSSGFTLTFSLEGDVLTTHVDPAGPDCGIECVIFFNSAPFVRQP
jgi:hypothetical protein